MNKQEFNQAFEVAKSDQDLEPLGLIFDGFALPTFRQVAVTITNVASLIRWQARNFDGSWDEQALNEIFAARRKFVVLGD